MQWLKQVLTRRRRYHELSESIREHLEERTYHLLPTIPQIILDIHTPSTLSWSAIRRWETGRLVHFSPEGVLFADFLNN
jgi:hypothetical protein